MKKGQKLTTTSITLTPGKPFPCLGAPAQSAFARSLPSCLEMHRKTLRIRGRFEGHRLRKVMPRGSAGLVPSCLLPLRSRRSHESCQRGFSSSGNGSHGTSLLLMPGAAFSRPPLAGPDHGDACHFCWYLPAQGFAGAFPADLLSGAHSASSLC